MTGIRSSYGVFWILEEESTKTRFKDMGTMWARSNGAKSDERPLRDKGIMPGMKLKALTL